MKRGKNYVEAAKLVDKTKLYDLGFSNIEILAIETINQDTQDHK